jgi:hypothetical protein
VIATAISALFMMSLSGGRRAVLRRVNQINLRDR